MPLSTTSGISDDDHGEGDNLLEFADIGLALDAASFFDSIDAVGDFTSGGDSSSSDGGDGSGGGD